jgi:hypothetical protein
MLLKTRTFFLPTYPSHIAQTYYRFSQSPLPRIILKHSGKPHSKRTYATTRPDLGGSSSANGSSTGGIPLGQINLGAGKIPAQKGVAIKDDITKSWKELSMPQKIVRTGTQTTNFAVVIVAVGVLVNPPLPTLDLLYPWIHWSCDD